jgi:hypothetical protein
VVDYHCPTGIPPKCSCSTLICSLGSTTAPQATQLQDKLSADLEAHTAELARVREQCDAQVQGLQAELQRAQQAAAQAEEGAGQLAEELEAARDAARRECEGG